MLCAVNVPGVQYEGETVEQMLVRDRRCTEWNAYVDAQAEYWAAQRARPWWDSSAIRAPVPPAWFAEPA